MKNDLLDLDALSVKLGTISDEIKKSEDAKHVEALASEVLGLMEYRTEYYYQFCHGGSATGFNWKSGELINVCRKILALIKLEQLDALPETVKGMDNCIKDITRMIEGDAEFRNPNEAVLKLYKPLQWMGASSFFVSYSHKDKLSRAIIPFIRFKIGSTINLWIDEYELKRHQQIPKELGDAISVSNASVLIPSRNFFKSKWCNEEWQSIFMKRLLDAQYRLYLIRIDNVKYPPLLDAFYYTDCRGYPKPRARVELGRLLSEIEEFDIYKSFRARHRMS